MSFRMSFPAIFLDGLTRHMLFTQHPLFRCYGSV